MGSFFIAVLAPFLWAVTNHIDKYLVTKRFRGDGVGALLLFSSAASVVFLPFMYFLKNSSLLISLGDIFLLLATGIVSALALWLYLFAIQKSDISTVVPLFQVLPVFSYILAVIFLDEHLSVKQIIASLLIVIGAVLITIFSDNKKFKVKVSVLWLMIVSSFLFSLESLLFKSVAISNDFWVANFWDYSGELLFALVIFMFGRKYREQFISIFYLNRNKLFAINAVNEILFMAASIVMGFATLLLPLAIAWVANGFQPFFVLLFGVLLAMFFPKLTDESLDKKYIVQKLIAIIIMFIGVYLLY